VSLNFLKALPFVFTFYLFIMELFLLNSVPFTSWLWALTLNEQKLTIFLWSVSRAMNSSQFSWMKQWHTHAQCSRQEQLSDAWVQSSYTKYFSNFCGSSSLCSSFFCLLNYLIEQRWRLERCTNEKNLPSDSKGMCLWFLFY